MVYAHFPLMKFKLEGLLGEIKIFMAFIVVRLKGGVRMYGIGEWQGYQ